MHYLAKPHLRAGPAPQVSVIIPAYNRAAWLEGCISSVIGQILPPAEVLVVDDGSTDSTPELLRRLASESPVPMRCLFQENRGAAAARNTGIRAAGGELLCFLDSDDRFMPQKIARQATLLAGSDALVSHTLENWLRRSRPLNQKARHRPPQGDIFATSLRMCMVGMSTVMARRELFDRYGFFDETLPCCEDYDFWLRVGFRERFLLVEEALTVKNGGRPDQLSVQHRQGMDRYRIRSLVKLLDSGMLSADQRQQTLMELERKCSIYGRGCIKHGRAHEGNAILAIPRRYTSEG